MNLDKERKKLDGKGEEIRSHVPTEAYRDAWERIWGKKRREAAECDSDGHHGKR